MKFLFNILTALFFTFSTIIATATTVSAVDSHSCEKLKGIDKQFILVLKRGENLSAAIIQCANDAKLPGASLAGLGALENPTLNYFNLTTKKFQPKTFQGIFEINSLVGNITKLEGKRVAHIHVALSDNQYHVMGGHLSNALVGIIAEITITPHAGQLVKKIDKDLGVAVICTESKK
jgi:predicted DNA-binding protein with PD1-like motif